MNFQCIIICIVSLIIQKSYAKSHANCDTDGNKIGVNGSESIPKATLDIISFNDVYHLDTPSDGRGGPSRVAPFTEKLRKQSKNSLVLFAGDTLSPSLWSGQFKGIQMIDALNALGTDYACLGNHEFDFGLDQFYNSSERSNFPWLNANCYENSTQQLLRGTQPYAIKNFHSKGKDSFKVGVFGIMYDMGANSKGLYWTDPIDAAKEIVGELKNQSVDYIICLSHQFWQDDNKLSSEVEDIDIIFGGHDHTAMLQTTFGAPYLKSDLDFKSIWQSHIEYYTWIDSKGRSQRKSKMTHENIPIDENNKLDKKFDEKIVKPYRDEIDSLFKGVAGSSCSKLDLLQKTVRVKDANSGHFCADAMLAGTANHNTNAAVMNGGGIRTDSEYDAGSLTVGDIMAISPFGNIVYVAQMSGAKLRSFLDYIMAFNCGAGEAIVENGEYMQPGGFTYTYTCTGEGKGSVTEIKWENGDDLGSDDTVILAITDYVYNSDFVPNVGDEDVELLVDAAEAVRFDGMLIEYVENQKEICYRDSPVRSVVSY